MMSLLRIVAEARGSPSKRKRPFWNVKPWRLMMGGSGGAAGGREGLATGLAANMSGDMSGVSRIVCDRSGGDMSAHMRD